jgi:hypothetical protein
VKKFKRTNGAISLSPAERERRPRKMAAKRIPQSRTAVTAGVLCFSWLLSKLQADRMQLSSVTIFWNDFHIVNETSWQELNNLLGNWSAILNLLPNSRSQFHG